jgi:hypothetical protein
MKSVMLDAMLKYNGWAAMSSYMSRTTSSNAVTVNPMIFHNQIMHFVGMDLIIS